ncbi:MAG: hypothetical protein K0R38_1904 [Polyangiaceae bacterium]|jgi:hypothetical protein|nr:hypothetical protein [Polyangiaceae bacterium]
MATLEIEHTYNCSEDTFWDRLFLDPEYNERLFKTELKFPVWREVSREERGGALHRVVEVVPYVGELPATLKAVIGEGVGYEERGVLDRAAKTYKVTVVPNKLAEKLSIKVDIWTVADGDKRCKRKVRADASVKIFGVGGAIEKRLLADMERSYQKSAEFTNRYVAEKGL